MLAFTLAAIGFLMTFVIQSLSDGASSISTIELKSFTNFETLAINLAEWTAQFRQIAPDPWDSSQFDPSRWDHYLLIIVFLSVSSWGLWLSWGWNRKEHRSRDKSSLAKESRKG